MSFSSCLFFNCRSSLSPFSFHCPRFFGSLGIFLLPVYKGIIAGVTVTYESMVRPVHESVVIATLLALCRSDLNSTALSSHIFSLVVVVHCDGSLYSDSNISSRKPFHSTKLNTSISTVTIVMMSWLMFSALAVPKQCVLTLANEVVICLCCFLIVLKVQMVNYRTSFLWCASLLFCLFCTSMCTLAWSMFCL